LKQALLSDFWDIVTVQQQSLQSASFETFEPYLSELVAYVRKILPRVKIYMNQTWGYADGSEKLENSPFATHEEMFVAIRDSYGKAKEAIGAAGIIPVGEAIAEAARQGRTDMHRDGFHLSLAFGRYLGGLVWYKTLMGKEFMENSFRDFDKPLSEEDVLAAKQIAVKVTTV
jgi:hypothetical protein